MEKTITGLVIDDEMVVSDIAQLILEQLGLKVDVAYSVEKAFEKINQNKYDLLWIDYALKDGNGISFFNMVKHRNPKVTAILMTGIKNPDIIKKAYDAGFFKVMFKPFNLDQIKELVEIINSKVSLQS